MASKEFQRAMANVEKLQQHIPPWRTGNPLEPGWYLVTVFSPHSGGYTVQAFFSKQHNWLWGDQLLGTRKDGYWPSLTTGAAVPVVAWMPLPEPYQPN